MESKYHSSTIQKALDILDLFNHHSNLTFTEIQKFLGYNKSTLFRLIYTLVANDYLRKNEMGQYELGLSVFLLGNRISLEEQLRIVAEPLMEGLSKKFDLTVHLGILDGITVIIIAKAAPLSGIKMVSRVGVSVPAHCTGQGKTLLAYSPKERIERIINTHGLNRYTPNTITTTDGLNQELEDIRQRGYTIDNSEHEKDIRCVAVPLLNEKGQIIAAISITGLITDFPDDKAIQAAADELFAIREVIMGKLFKV